MVIRLQHTFRGKGRSEARKGTAVKQAITAKQNSSAQSIPEGFAMVSSRPSWFRVLVTVQGTYTCALAEVNQETQGGRAADAFANRDDGIDRQAQNATDDVLRRLVMRVGSRAQIVLVRLRVVEDTVGACG